MYNGNDILLTVGYNDVIASLMRTKIPAPTVTTTQNVTAKPNERLMDELAPQLGRA